MTTNIDPENKATLLQALDELFSDTHTKEQVFTLLRIGLHAYSTIFRRFLASGGAQIEDVGAYQWSSSAVATLIRALEVGPEYGPKLEAQLKALARELVNSSAMGDASLPDSTSTRVPNTQRKPS